MSDTGCTEAEAAVLGCLLALPLQPAKDVAWALHVEDFTDPRHRVVFEAIGDCILADLMAAAPVPASAPHYARILIEHRARRRLVEAAERLRQIAEKAPLDTVRDVALEEWTALTAAFNRLERSHQGPSQVVA